MQRNVLPDWYPKPHHLEPITLNDWLNALRNLQKQYKKIGLHDFINDNYQCARGKYSYALTIRSWRKLKVLDFLEIDLFSKKNNIWLDGAFFAAALFADDEITSIRDRLLQHTKPLSFSLISENGLSTLEELLKNNTLGNVKL